jgi:hypothetical protein
LVFEIATYYADDCVDAFVKRNLPITFALQLQVVNVREGGWTSSITSARVTIGLRILTELIHTIRILFIIATLNIGTRLAH